MDSCGITICATQPEQGDLSVNLVPKGERARASHAIALDIRKRLEGLPLPAHSSVKVVEVPPGPPVLSTLLAEIYGPDAHARRDLAANVRKAFETVDFVVDDDDSFGVRPERMRFSIDQEALEFHGVEEQAVYDTLGAILGGREDRLFAARRRAEANRYHGGSAEVRAGAERTICFRRRCPPAERPARAPMWSLATSCA